jgi:hypothetical protein
MLGEPVGQGGGRLIGERYDPTVAPGYAELVGRPAVGAPEDVAESEGAHLAGTEAHVTQQPHDGPVAHTDRGLRVGMRSSRSYWSGVMVSGGGAWCREARRLVANSGWPAWRTSWRRTLHSSRNDAGDKPRPLWPPTVARRAIQRARTSPLRS